MDSEHVAVTLWASNEILFLLIIDGISFSKF
jgi:hypothetical protein